MSRPGRPSNRARVVRRRRAAVLGAMVVVVGVAVALATSGSGHRTPRFTPDSGEIATVITPPAPRLPRVHVQPFTPTPAAVRAAGAMSLADQVAQLFLVSADAASTPWGGVVLTGGNIRSRQQVTARIAAVSAASGGGVAPLVAAGPGFHGALDEASIGAAGQPALARSDALAAGEALRRLGVEMTISPLADVDTLDGALSGELFGTDPATVARFSLAAADGYAAAGELAAAAHFPGEGGASEDPDQMTATVGGTLAALESRDLIPFAAIVPHVPVIVMSNAEYTAFDGVTPASLLPAAVTLLRKTYGFSGVVMSDDLDATLDPTGQSPGQVAVRALQAGDDLLYISGPPGEHAAAYAAVLTLAQHNAAARALVHEALLRDLTLKARAGLLSTAGDSSSASTTSTARATDQATTSG